MTANSEPSNQSFEIDREATVCTASRRFLPLCGRESAAHARHVASRPISSFRPMSVLGQMQTLSRVYVIGPQLKIEAVKPRPLDFPLQQIVVASVSCQSNVCRREKMR